MAYMPRPDGLNDVVLPDGTQVPSGLSAQQLESMGHSPVAPQGPNPFAGLPPDAVAGPGGGPSQPWRVQLPPIGDAPPGVGGVAFGAPGVHDKFASVRTQLSPDGPSLSKPSPSLIHLAEAQSHDKELADVSSMSPAKRQAYFEKQDEKQGIVTKLPEPGADQNGLIPIGASNNGMAGPPGTGVSPGRTVKVKGGDVRASFVRTPGEEVSDDVKSDLTNNGPEQLDIATVQNGEERDKQRLDVDHQLLEQQQQVDQAQARRAKIDGMLQQKQQLIDQRDRETEKLTPQTAREVWDDKSTLAQVFGGLSVILGGYMQGLQGRATNPGLDMINNSIRDEVNDQRAKYEAGLKKGQEVRNDYSQALSLYGTPEAAALDLEMRRNSLAAKIIQNHGEAITDREKQQAAFQVADQMRQQRGELKLKLNELEHGKVLQENWVNVPDRYVTMGGPPKLTKEQREDKIDARKRQIRIPGGGYVYANNEAHVRALQDQVTAGSNSLDAINKILALMPPNGGPVTDLNKRKEIAAIQDRALSSISASEKQGVVTKADAERATATLADPNALFTDGNAALRATQSVIRNNMQAAIRDNTYADPDATTPVRSGDAQSFTPGL